MLNPPIFNGHRIIRPPLPCGYSWLSTCVIYSGLPPIAILPGAGSQNRRRMRMRDLTMSFLIRLHKDEAGQGLVEYLLILALIAFAATAGMGSLASGLNSAFSAVGSLLGAYIT